MKKILIALSMLSMGITSTQAQVAYEKAKPFDNVYLGVEAGAMGPLNLSHFAPLNATAGVKVGKQFSLFTAQTSKVSHSLVTTVGRLVL